jgi:flagellar biosynthesis/type III secretory pathway protein FliH
MKKLCSLLIVALIFVPIFIIVTFLSSCSFNNSAKQVSAENEETTQSDNNSAKQVSVENEETTQSEYKQGYEKGYDVAWGLAYNFAQYFYSGDSSADEKPTVPDILQINESSEFLKGYKDGYVKGLDEGYVWGLEDAEYISQNAVEKSALNAVIAEYPFLSDVLQHAEEKGEENGYCEGYNEGYDEGYNNGYDDGFDDATEGD